MSLKTMRDNKRTELVATLMKLVSEYGEDCGQTGSGEFNFPIVLEDGTEDWAVIKISMPTGTRDGEAYDGYDARDDYDVKCAERKIKAAEVAAKKAAKIERDRKMREAKAKKEKSVC